MLVCVLLLLLLAMAPCRCELVLSGDVVADLAAANFTMAVLTEPDESVCSASQVDPCLTLATTRSGWDVLSAYVGWAWTSDDLVFGVRCVGACGDADGDGDPSAPNPVDVPSMRGCESIMLLIDASPLSSVFTPTLALGVPGAPCCTLPCAAALIR